MAGLGSGDDIKRYRIQYSPTNKPPGRSQRKFHNNNTARYKGFFGPVGTGKTLTLCQEAVKLALTNSGLDGALAAGTNKLLRKLTEPTLEWILRTSNIPYHFIKAQTERRIVLLDTGSRMWLHSMHDPDALRGDNLAWFVVDEGTIAPWKSHEQLQARLRVKHAPLLQGCVGGTPKGFDENYDFWMRNNPNDGTRFLVRAEPGENAANLASDYYERLRGSLDEETYEQEVLGAFINLNAGRAYKTFDQRNNVKFVEYDSRYPICWSLDFNVSPACSVIGQEIEPIMSRTQPWMYDVQRPNGGTIIHVFDEIALMNSGTEEACREFQEKVQKYRHNGTGVLVVQVTADGTGMQRHSSSNTTDHVILRDFFRGHPWLRMVDKIASSNPEVRDRVNTVKAFCRNAAGITSLYINPRCRMLIDDLAQVGWPKDAKGNTHTQRLDTSKPMLTHISDALGYWLWKISPLRGTVGEMSGGLPI